MARLNEMMKQMKLNSPVYITNFEPGKYYNPYINQNYIPNGVRKDIPLPDFERYYDRMMTKGSKVNMFYCWLDYKNEHPDGYQVSQFYELFKT